MSRLELIEYIGAGLAIIGAILLALNIHLEVAAFVVYLLSNSFLAYFAWKKKHKGILIMTLVFVIINFIGIIRWF